MRWLGYGLCHQLPERSFFAGVHQVPVCARDTGIYIGFVLSFAVLTWMAKGKRPSELPSWGGLLLFAAFVGAMAYDGVTSYAGLRTTTNEIRLATGLLAGYAMPLLLIPILNGQLWRAPGSGRVLAGVRGTIVWLIPLPLAFAIVRWPFGMLGVAYPLLVAVAILATFTTVNLALVSILPVAEGRAERLRDIWWLVAAALLLTVLEISAAAWARVLLTGLTAGVR